MLSPKAAEIIVPRKNGDSPGRPPLLGFPCAKLRSIFGPMKNNAAARPRKIQGRILRSAAGGGFGSLRPKVIPTYTSTAAP
jgi:hypothetical protein